MNPLDQWQERRRQIEAALANGRIAPDEAARELAHLDYRIRRRPLILKRRRDRKAWQQAQAAKLAERLMRAERAREIEQIKE